MDQALSEEPVVTVDDGSRCFLLDDASTGHLAEWTNEKHYLYIGSLERSFLDQLQQHSKILCGGELTQETGQGLPISFDEVVPGTKLRRNQPFDTLQQNSMEVHVTRNSTFSSAMQQPIGSITEYTDQNFVEEYEEEPKYAPFSKRMRRSPVDASANDQVVPMAKGGNHKPSLGKKNLLSEKEQVASGTAA